MTGRERPTVSLIQGEIGPSARHGNASTYRRGCRCAECKKAHTARILRMTADRTRRLAEDPSLAPHGKRSTYSNWGCRCELCTEANTVACRPYKVAWRIKVSA